MTQEILPDIQTATQALESGIALTETEITHMKESIKAKRALLRSCRKALSAFSSRKAHAKKKRAPATQ